jgi:glycosyltransferase involved in cell wall biosynthesis
MKVSDIASGVRLIAPGRTYQKPKVSIVTPTYCRNEEGLLAKCLDSAMAQTFADFELIVIDDGSSDGSEFTIRDAAFRDERIVYLRHDRNSGLPAIRTNEGIMRARGEAVVFLFDDNVFDPDFIETAWNALEASGADVVHTNVHMFAKEGKDFTLGGWPLTLELLRNLNTIPNGGVMVRRSFFDRYGLYDPHILMRRICDWDLWLRALALGARFCHVEGTGAFEHGLRSANSIGNTIAWDVKIACAYMLDDSRYADRAGRLTPQAIGDYDVLAPAPIRPYVRSEREWSELVDIVYKPFIDRHGANGFDPASLGNRAAALDPRAGWNAEWSLIGNRRRYLVVSNSVNAWASAWLHALRQHPGAIVANCPEWQLSSFRPLDIDLLVLLDCTSGFLKPQLDAFRTACVPIFYVVGYGEQASNATPAAVINRHFENNQHIAGLLGHEFYFPQTGTCFDADRREGARVLIASVYAAVSSHGDAGRLMLAEPILFPFASVAISGAAAIPTNGPLISYQIDNPDIPDADEVVTLPGTSYVTRNRTVMRPSWEGLGALVESRPRSRIVMDADVLDAAPLAERVGLAALAQRHEVTLTSGRRTAPTPSEPPIDHEASPQAWQDWIANLARCSQLARHVAQARHQPARRPKVGIFLNSEMFSGSEVYGLMLARGLQSAGAHVRVLIPDESGYGEDADASPLNAWLQAYGIPAAGHAPYRPGAPYLALAPAERSTRLAQLEGFLGKQQFDLIVCAGFMPQFADLSQARAVLLMALFQPSAYRQSELAYLRGRVSGIISDTDWALAAHLRLLGAPGAVIRSMLPVEPGALRMMKVPRTSGAIRVAIGGTLQPRKRQLEAIKAAGLLRDRGLAVQLNIYGYQLAMLRSYVDDLKRAVAELHLQGLVTFHGLVGMHVIARDNDIMLSASVDESLPQTLIEMVRSGLIGVAGLSGGIDELIEDGTTGYLTSDLSPQGLADALEQAISDRERWPEVAANAYALVGRDYSIAKNTTALLDLLIECAQLESSPYGRLGRDSI